MHQKQVLLDMLHLLHLTAVLKYLDDKCQPPVLLVIFLLLLLVGRRLSAR
jgi:hypothetical protein